ncbi:Osmotically-inducible protein OsmY, contains BON domain [Cupriavidus sp. YR651]|uniref:BON domain-containing protein n=1 Tax=Cupriavidus sp. YR651 TaxID=1855315 RepID=UPI000886C0E2|nr:BON domain-containing protein [Cupriavidus sp. YR651]SDD82434.1 Osmotically-inducible protein OsmY, contains BON domain [Cupriavidus sp. YR651]
MKTDLQLKKEVSDELTWDPSIHAAGIGVEVNDGIVTLSGHVKTYLEKVAAGLAAERVAGVKGTVLELHVGEQHGQTDETLAMAARAAMQWYVHVPDDAIKIRVEDGWVSLAGDVEWGYQRHAAERAVAHLRGVKGVTNGIAVRPQLEPHDVANKIEAALRRHAEREAHHIEVKAEGGIVTLGGFVDSIEERHAAAGAAWSAPGVSQVINNLKIR